MSDYVIGDWKAGVMHKAGIEDFEKPGILIGKRYVARTDCGRSTKGMEPPTLVGDRMNLARMHAFAELEQCPACFGTPGGPRRETGHMQAAGGPDAGP